MNKVDPRLELLFKVVLVILASYHVITGVVAVFFPGFSRWFYQWLYHAQPYYWDQYRLILKPWGSYALFTGALLWFALFDPRRHKAVIWGMTGLLCIRVFNRLVFQDEALTVLGIDHARNYLNAGLMVFWALVLTAWSIADGRAQRAEQEAREQPQLERQVLMHLRS